MDDLIRCRADQVRVAPASRGPGGLTPSCIGPEMQSLAHCLKAGQWLTDDEARSLRTALRSDRPEVVDRAMQLLHAYPDEARVNIGDRSLLEAVADDVAFPHRAAHALSLLCNWLSLAVQQTDRILVGLKSHSDGGHLLCITACSCAAMALRVAFHRVLARTLVEVYRDRARSSSTVDAARDALLLSDGMSHREIIATEFRDPSALSIRADAVAERLLQSAVGMDVLSSLQSTDTSEVIDALYRLGSSRKDVVTQDIIDSLARLVDHAEADVREEVAVAAGIRLRLLDLYPLFFVRLNGIEEEESVLPPLIDATVALSLHGAGDRRELSALLGQYVLDHSKGDEVRGTAYLALLKLWDKITPREYAAAPRSLSEMAWDRDLIQSLVR